MNGEMSEAETLEALETDLDVAECIDILECFGVDWCADLAVALWEWKQAGGEQ